jgi:anti-sigma-K factor RskA
MKHDDPRLIDALAAEYVLGTLRGSARARFERWRAAEWHIERRVQAWEERFAPFVFALPPVQPSQHVWARIASRIAAGDASGSRMQKRRPVLRAIAAALVLIAVLAGGFAIWQSRQAPSYEPFAAITQANGAMAWELEMDTRTGRMRMEAMPGVPSQPGHSFELWALPDNGGAPMSLGLLPAAGHAEHSLSSAQLTVLTRASKVAVSLEPVGGSPTGAPTGAVLFVAERSKRA